MGSFTGTEAYHVDDKGRLMMPIKYRRELDSLSETILYLMKMQDGSILVYQNTEWEKVEKELVALSDFIQEERMLKMMMYASVEKVEIDKQGRIMIPKRFLEDCGIKREVKIVGAGNKIAIWSPEKFLESMSKTIEKFETLAQRLFS